MRVEKSSQAHDSSRSSGRAASDARSRCRTRREQDLHGGFAASFNYAPCLSRRSTPKEKPGGERSRHFKGQCTPRSATHPRKPPRSLLARHPTLGVSHAKDYTHLYACLDYMGRSISTGSALATYARQCNLRSLQDCDQHSELEEHKSNTLY